MGRKRTRAREFIYFCTAGLIFFALLGCTSIIEKEKSEWKEEQVQTEKIQKEDLSKEEPPKVSEHLLRARKLLEQRDFDGSLKENQKILSVSSQNSPADEALFNMGLIYAHFGNPKKDYSKSIGFFRKLVKEYPESPFVEQAKIWTGILQENEKLSQTIQKLNQVIEESKDVDIQIEEKKREKAK
ncbi:MAG: tetratricopeptide repeat protein [Thermodesulfobacteriota bacterium]